MGFLIIIIVALIVGLVAIMPNFGKENSNLTVILINFLMNVIDGILCFILTAFYPYPVSVEIYDFNKYLYYFLGACFSFLPIIFCKSFP